MSERGVAQLFVNYLSLLFIYLFIYHFFALSPRLSMLFEFVVISTVYLFSLSYKVLSCMSDDFIIARVRTSERPEVREDEYEGKALLL